MILLSSMMKNYCWLYSYKVIREGLSYQINSFLGWITTHFEVEEEKFKEVEVERFEDIEVEEERFERSDKLNFGTGLPPVLKSRRRSLRK